MGTIAPTAKFPLRVLLLLAAAFCWTYAGTFVHLARQWTADANYSHGFLVLPFSCFVAWRRRAALASAPLAPSGIGLALMMISAALYLAGQLGAEAFLTRVSLIGMVAGIVGFVWGTAHLRLLAFPIAFLLFMIPLPAILFNQITLPLQFVASSLGETLIRGTGIPVLRDGNVLQLPNTNLEVVEACSGIRSLVSLSMIAVVLSFWRSFGRWTSLLTVAAAIPASIATNALRVAAIGVASNFIGGSATKGIFHELTGVVTFVAALAAVCVAADVVARVRGADSAAGESVRGLA